MGWSNGLYPALFGVSLNWKSHHKTKINITFKIIPSNLNKPSGISLPAMCFKNDNI
jgi:hypothetical protein